MPRLRIMTFTSFMAPPDPRALATARHYVAGLERLGARLWVTPAGVIDWRPRRGVLRREDKAAIKAHAALIAAALGSEHMRLPLRGELPAPEPTPAPELTPTGERVAIIGSRPRAWPHPDAVRDYVAALVADLPAGTVVVSGGAEGVDTWAVDAAKTRGLPFVVHPADWQAHGRSAGAIRNAAIVADCDRLIALHGIDPKTGELSAGTNITVTMARQAGKLERVVTWEEIAAGLPEPPNYTSRQAALVADVQDRTRRLTAATTPQGRAALLRTMPGPIASLRGEIDQTETWLTEADVWLSRHQGRQDVAKHEDRYLGTLRAYEGMQDCLRAATAAL
jgi:hypothetical protein